MEDKMFIYEKEYGSKSDRFILPLTKLEKGSCTSYMFWRDCTIEDYKLILVFKYESYEKFSKDLTKTIIPILDKYAPILESYDFDKETVLIVDLSEWAFDIDKILEGKYSILSKSAKDLIVVFHTKNRIINTSIFCCLYPKENLELLEGLNALEYLADLLNIDRGIMTDLGEVGRIYDKEKETLCHIS